MKNILFVCLGNICRSPAAEGVMTALVQRAGLAGEIRCDSAGTIGYHAGEPADHRMRHSAAQRGYELTSISRKVDPEVDFEKFDLIVAMDDENLRDLRAMDRDQIYAGKMHKMTDFCRRSKASYVPDPYYGGAQGFENVLDILEDACGGLLEKLRNEPKS